MSFPNKNSQFPKGKSGNPDGRPKGSKNISTILKEKLDEIAPDVVFDNDFIKEFCKKKKRVTNADATAAKILYEALVNGEPWAIKEVIDRTEGKPVQAVEMEANVNHSGKIEFKEAAQKIFDKHHGTDQS